MRVTIATWAWCWWRTCALTRYSDIIVIYIYIYIYIYIGIPLKHSIFVTEKSAKLAKYVCLQRNTQVLFHVQLLLTHFCRVNLIIIIIIILSIILPLETIDTRGSHASSCRVATQGEPNDITSSTTNAQWQGPKFPQLRSRTGWQGRTVNDQMVWPRFFNGVRAAAPPGMLPW